jgi:hypothetical protein
MLNPFRKTYLALAACVLTGFAAPLWAQGPQAIS